MKVAISGFGRIGRLALRIMAERKALGNGIDVVAINDTHDPKAVAFLLKHDSTHGKYAGSIELQGNSLVVDGYPIQLVASRDPLALPWAKMDVDTVLEATGAFNDREGASKHLTAGAKKVLLSAPGKNPDVTIVPGVNEEMYKKSGHKIISLASCTTNSLAPMAKVIEDNYGIETGFMTTVHAYTNDQKVLDDFHKDLRRARNAATNIIPTSTGAAKAIGEVIPSLKGKLDGLSLRVPVPTGSITDLTVVLSKSATKEEVNARLKEAAEGRMKGIMAYTEEPIVSSDIVTDPHSSTIDGLSTRVIGNNLKVLSWYDNEWGYSNRVVDAIQRIL
ncbi:MAG TPA: type I glyceraldehyde-3-phosphate dehydrogenase [Candidatus Micrarchaeota archaeon]|nr:type I glyceraldehyde-3-phosphate dehydrogenase [Candidatus Micrarchaeota archaeon]